MFGSLSKRLRQLPSTLSPEHLVQRWRAAPTLSRRQATGALAALAVLAAWSQRHWEGDQEYRATRWVFLRSLGVVYLVAFGSLYRQIPGLIGKGGVLPVAEFLQSVPENLGTQRYYLLPTLAWLNPGDTALRGMAGGGIALSLLLIVGVLPGPALVALYVLYLSLMTAGQDFLGFQWDTLLLETGFVSIFLAPGQIVPRFRQETPPSRMVVWLMRLLVFRLMWFSGYVKLASGDPTWHNLTALNYHYETQPLPTPVAWYANQLPATFQKASTVTMFMIELAVPFLIFLPRRARIAGAIPLAGLQLLIMLTGNYGFFNLLSIVLCIMLLDDAALARLLPAVLRKRFAAPDLRPSAPRWRVWLLAPVAALVLGLNIVQIVSLVWRGRGLPERAIQIAGELEPFHVVNRYGLFAVMTTSRPEIVIEGSQDAITWLPYTFKYKPVDLRRPPQWSAPYQPRLDWQMWFAALGNARSNPWFSNLLLRLLQGSPEVLDLLASNPFPDAPPRYVRAVAYNYHFTNRTERAATGDWWRRDELGLYFPAVALPQSSQ